MATYKVIQDIEAEDKLVGPLTLRQFIYAGVSAICLYICFLAYTKHATFLIGIFLPVAAIGAFFAFPWKGEQPTEIWALARLRFMIKPRIRVWNQSGVKDLVTITAPKKLENIRPKTNNLSQTEVQSRLKALADTIDSRGWATRNAAYSAYARAGNNTSNVGMFAGTGNLQPGAVPSEAFAPNNDMFDMQNSVVQNFDAMLNRSTQNIRERAMMQMQQAQMPAAPVAPTQPQAAVPMYQAPPTSMGPQLPAPVYNGAPAATPAPMYNAPAPAIAASRPPAPDNSWFMSNPSYPPNAASPAPAPAPMSAPTALPASMQPHATQMPIAPMPEPVAPDIASAPHSALVPPTPEQSQQNVFVLPGNIPVQTGPLPMPTAPKPTQEDLQMAQQIKDNMPPTQSINYGHMKVVQPMALGGEFGGTPVPAPAPTPTTIDYGMPGQPPVGSFISQPQPGPAPAPAEPVTRKPDPAILDLANNDDLDVATIARQASKEIRKSPDEVEIRLH